MEPSSPHGDTGGSSPSGKAPFDHRMVLSTLEFLHNQLRVHQFARRAHVKDAQSAVEAANQSSRSIHHLKLRMGRELELLVEHGFKPPTPDTDDPPIVDPGMGI